MRHEVDIKYVIANRFDGAATMSGLSSNKDLSAKLKGCAPLSIYVHCYDHLLNLALQKTIIKIKIL